jgi:hypothetical protein
MNQVRRASTRGVLTLLLVITTEAGAFCRARTCDISDPRQNCEADENECVTTGPTLFWASSCVSFSVQKNGSPARDIDAATATKVARRAFTTWARADCEGEPPSIGFADHGLVACAASEYNEDGYNANAIIFRDDQWPYPGAADVYGFTRLRFNPNTGELYDADIEINSADFDVSIDGDGVDLESILIHEIGHFLGLAHTSPELEDATMSTTWNGVGTELRSLSADDEAGICTGYPPTRSAVSKSCEPRHGFAKECEVPLPDEEGGCSLVPTRTKGPAFGVYTALLTSLGWLRRRRIRHV